MTLALAALAALLLADGASAQNLVITNGRVLDGTGRVLERATVVVRDGRIVSVGQDAPAGGGGAGETIDAGGKTVMPGLIDAHRHLVQGNDGAAWLANRAAAQMQEFLDAGFTTVLSPIDPPQVLEARKRIAEGSMQGPRVFAAAFLPVAGQIPGSGAPAGEDPARTDPARLPFTGPAAPAIPHEATIQAVERAKQAGYDYLKVVLNTTPNGPEIDTLKLIVEEGKKRGLPTIVHAVSVRDTLAALEARPALLVHTPHIGQLDDAAVKKIVDAHIPMTSTLAVFVPHFDAEGTPLFRDAKPFPWSTLSSAGQGPVNARLLWQAGMVYGYGTDTQWPPQQSLADELRALDLVFAPKDIVQIITKNAAEAMMHGDDFGTLEPGKLADIVIVDGDPMRDSRALLHVVTTIKEGRVVARGGAAR
ncbi:MAG TPA: amidohydrolase family protein [Gammaproteobacteria bacterium]|nr:amidohydrolase family protein [Gammaproteobacteria bacterium]